MSSVQPRYTLSIDNGGTFTDAVVSDGHTLVSVKVLTTPHDLTVAFRKVLDQAAARLGVDVVEFLKRTACVRYSTTIGTNAIIERSGPRLGLLVSAADLPAFVGLPSDSLLAQLLAPPARWVRGLELSRGVDAAQVLAAAEELLHDGAERLVVSLSGDHAVELEQEVKRVLLAEYPRHILGALPMLFSSEVTGDPDAGRRTATALLNAYLHPSLEHFLYKAEDVLRAHRYSRPLFIYGNDGTSNRVAKVTAIKTYNSGPTGGVDASVHLAAACDTPDLVAVDIGGTSSDITFIAGRAAERVEHGRVEDTVISLPLSDIRGLGAGGGTIASLRDGKLKVGPESAGAAPGPACFGFGGENPTVTDANVVVGYLADGAVLAGQVTVDASRARRALESKIARPLGISVEEAASRVIAVIEQRVADAIARELEARGRAARSTTLLAFGGAGPMHACGIAEAVGIRRVIVPALSSVFSAFGIGTSDVVHEYRGTVNGARETVLATMERRAFIDMKGEGFDAGEVSLRWSAQGMAGSWAGRGETMQALRASAEGLVTLRAAATLPKVGFAAVKSGRKAAAPSARRAVTFGGGGKVEALVHRAEDLEHAAVKIAGPAIVEAADTTIVVAAGWTLTRDGTGQYLLSRKG